MKHQTVVQASVGQVSVTQQRRFFVYGGFQSGASLPPCMMFCAHLLRAQVPVYTVAGHATAACQHKISFATNYKYQKTSAAVFETLKDCTDIVLYLHAFTAPVFSSKHPWRRIKERVRLARFAQNLLGQQKRVWLIGSRAEQSLFKTFVSLPVSADITMQTAAGSLGVPQEDWDKIRDISDAEASDIVNLHARSAYGNGRMDAISILSSVQKNARKDPQLAMICRLSLSKRLQNHPLIARIKATNGVIEPILRTLPPHRALDIATAMDDARDVSAYAVHLHRLFAADDAPDQVANWYTKQAHKLVPSGWVPALDRPAQKSLDLPELHHVDHLCAFFQGEVAMNDLGTELRTALQTAREPSGPTGLVLLMAILCGQTAHDLAPNALWRDVRLTQWFDANVAALEPMLKSVPAASLSVLAKRNSISVIGLQSGGSGLAQNMEMSCLALSRMGLMHRTRDTHDFYDMRQPRQTNPRPPKRNVALHHVNAERIPMHLMSPDYAKRNDIYHIGFALWETSALPREHDLGIKMIDEIWAPSTFVADLYRDHGAPCVTNVGKGIPQLAELGFMANTGASTARGLTCLTAFDFHSSVERKNPLAAVEAFEIAFPKLTHPDHRMIVKYTPCVTQHWGDPLDQLGQIKKRAAKDPRIELMGTFLERDAYMDLLASADCIISSHRGEGFGYLAAYGLALAKPVIATDFGGTQDFCTQDTSFLLRPYLRDVPQGHAIYDAPDAQWADVDPEEIAHNLRHIDGDRDHAQTRAFAGKAFVGETYSMAALVDRYSARLREIGAI